MKFGRQIIISVMYKKGVSAFGHRGAAGHAPENTLSAVQKALDIGVDWIEVDVQRVQDRLIVMHDSVLDRTTNGTGQVASCSLEKIRRLDAGRGEPVPLMEEIFERVNRKCGINIELKGPETAGLATDIALYYIHGKAWRPDQILISSFDLEQLRTVRDRSGTLQLAPLCLWLSPVLLRQAVALEVAAIHLHDRFVRRQTVSKIHAHHMRVHVYTVNKYRRIYQLIQMGVDGIFSDFPERIMKARKML